MSFFFAFSGAHWGQADPMSDSNGCHNAIKRVRTLPYGIGLGRNKSSICRTGTLGQPYSF